MIKNKACRGEFLALCMPSEDSATPSISSALDIHIFETSLSSPEPYFIFEAFSLNSAKCVLVVKCCDVYLYCLRGRMLDNMGIIECTHVRRVGVG